MLRRQSADMKNWVFMGISWIEKAFMVVQRVVGG
jgi:hypothetical protein